MEIITKTGPIKFDRYLPQKFGFCGYHCALDCTTTSSFQLSLCSYFHISWVGQVDICPTHSSYLPALHASSKSPSRRVPIPISIASVLPQLRLFNTYGLRTAWNTVQTHSAPLRALKNYWRSGLHHLLLNHRIYQMPDLA